MSSGEHIGSAPNLFPLSLEVSRRCAGDFYPSRKDPLEVQRIQATINEEIGIIAGTEDKPRTNPQVWEFMRLMSAYLNNGPSIPALRVGMVALYHAARLQAEETQVSLPIISKGQLGKYFLERKLDWEGDEIVTYKGDFNWAEVLSTFQTEEENFMTALSEKGITASRDYPSFGFGCALMRDLLKTAPELK